MFSAGANHPLRRLRLAGLQGRAVTGVVLSLLLCTTTKSVFAQGRPQWVAGELLVGLRAGVSRTRAEEVYGKRGARLRREYSPINVHVLAVPAALQDAIEHARSLLPEIQFVKKNRWLAPDLTPNDSLYPNQWHLQKIAAPLAWNILQGTPGVTIAILDSGVDATHPDLAAKLVPGYNFYDNNTNTADVYGHGTMVAGVAAALSNNGIGVASVAWQNPLMPLRVTDTQGYASVSTIAQALIWAADHGAKVFNLSFSGVAGSATIRNAAQYAVSKGGIVVAAAGNCGCSDPTAENPYVLSVSATDSNDALASFSSRGPFVDLSAPGVSIYTTTRGGGYGPASGTSFSSPITAGVIALIMSANPNLTPNEIETFLEATTDDLGTAGYDSSFGFGRVNAHEALATVVGVPPAPSDTASPTATITSPNNGAIVSGSITVNVSATDDVGVSQVALYRDGILSATDTAAPFSFSWSTAQSSNGGHTLQAIARDAAGNSASSALLSLTVNNVVGDTTAPTVDIVSPANGITLPTQTVKVKTSARDNVQVRKVEVYADGNKVDSANCSTASCSPTLSWNTKSASKGLHLLWAKAYDATGNVAESSPVSVYK
jgi:subtilisin family serine protease